MIIINVPYRCKNHNKSMYHRFVIVITNSITHRGFHRKVKCDTLAVIAASQNLAEIEVKPLLELKNNIYIYMSDILNDPFTYAVSFYLVIGVAGKVKK